MFLECIVVVVRTLCFMYLTLRYRLTFNVTHRQEELTRKTKRSSLLLEDIERSWERALLSGIRCMRRREVRSTKENKKQTRLSSYQRANTSSNRAQSARVDAKEQRREKRSREKAGNEFENNTTMKRNDIFTLPRHS